MQEYAFMYQYLHIYLTLIMQGKAITHPQLYNNFYCFLVKEWKSQAANFAGSPCNAE